MKRFIISFFLPLIAVVFCATLMVRATPVFAANAADPFGLQGTRNETQYKDSKKTIPEIVGGLINVALSIIGFVFLGLALYSGFKWMTAQGNEKDVTKARDTLINATIGIVLIVAAYAITSFIFTDVIDSITGPNDPGAAVVVPAGDPAPAAAGTPAPAPEPVIVFCCYDKDNKWLGNVIADSIGDSANSCKDQYPYFYASSSKGACPAK